MRNFIHDYPVVIGQSLWHRVQRNATPWANASLLPKVFQLKDGFQLLLSPMLSTNEFFASEEPGVQKAIGVNLSPTGGLRNALLSQWSSDRPTKKIPFWNVKTKRFRESADLIAMEGPLLFIKNLPHHNALILPRCVNHTLDVSGNWQEVRSRFHQTIKTNELRRVRKYGYQFDKSNNFKDFSIFYDRMYLPTMRERHGTAVSLSSKSKLQELFDHGFLLRVFRDETWVAGALCEFRCGGLRLCALGVLQSDTTLIKQGVMGTIYVGVIQTANNLSCGQLDLTVSAPFFFDGLFQHKRNWGTSISPYVSEQGRIWIQFLRYTPAIHRFLKMNPMITINQDGKLEALIALENICQWTEEEATTWKRRYLIPGLSSIRILPLDRFRESGILSFEAVS